MRTRKQSCSSKQTYRKHLVGLVENEHLYRIRPKEATLNHVVDTARGTDDDLGAILKGLHVIAHAGPTNASVALDVHEVADSDNDLLNLLSKLAGGGEDKSLGGLERYIQLGEVRLSMAGAIGDTALTFWRIEMEKVAVLPVPDWAWAITSCPFTTGTMARC